MKKIGLFFSMLMCMFMVTTANAQDDYSRYNNGAMEGQNYGMEGQNYGAEGQGADCGTPCEKPMNDCYCLYCKYEPCYYTKTRYVCEPKYSYKKCCRYVPQYYEKKCCRYVPQYYSQTCCRQVPQYYYTCQCNYVKKPVCEKCCKYVPKYYYKHTKAPTCDENSCQQVR